MSKNVIIIGAGGHAKVIADIIEKSNDKVLGFLDDNKEKNQEIYGYKVIGKISECETFTSKDIYFIIAIGNNLLRKKIYEEYELQLYTAIHPTSVIAKGVQIGEGTVIMANACINADAIIGKNCIINTGAIIEHDNIIEDYVHISPRAVLAGTVKIGELTHIGVGVTVKNNITICKECIIGAGAVVVKDLVKSDIYIGVPAKIKTEKEIKI